MAASHCYATQRYTPSRDDQPLLDVSSLLGRVALGDSAGFAELYDEFAPTVFAAAHTVLRHREIAEEVTQDVFVWLWRNAHVFDPARGSALPLILTVTRRRAVDAVRREAAIRKRTSAYFQTVERPIDHLASVEDEDEVERLMARLTALEREAVRLHYWDGLTGRELAAELGTNVATARSRQHAGVVRMRRPRGHLEQSSNVDGSPALAGSG